MIRSVLIANRGEIAVRITRTLRELGVEAVAIYADDDRANLHVLGADRALPLAAKTGYLDGEQIVRLARDAGCDAIHPGYGFLSENADFAEACARAGLEFIGPPAAAIRAMGSKQNARRAMQAAGVPVVPGGDASTLEEARRTAASVGYPVLVKATDGGGGKGMHLVESEPELAAALERTRREALNAFGSAAIYIEKAIYGARHVEIQVLGDRHGTLFHLFERDCSVQRRHQKIIEETPCPVLTPETRQAMGEVALRGAASIGYFSAGTFEFLLDPSGSFYFLEMNTRLQVEHPITELVTGIDLVREMLFIAEGRALGKSPTSPNGAAIEARIYAEDPAQGFLPCPGDISGLSLPGGPFVRNDSGVYAGARVSDRYDPLLAKLSVWAPDREQARLRMQRALGEYAVRGITTNLGFLARVVLHPAFASGDYDTGFVERHVEELTSAQELDPNTRIDLAAASAVAAQRAARSRAPSVRSDDEPSGWVRAHRASLK